MVPKLLSYGLFLLHVILHMIFPASTHTTIQTISLHHHSNHFSILHQWINTQKHFWKIIKKLAYKITAHALICPLSTSNTLHAPPPQPELKINYGDPT